MIACTLFLTNSIVEITVKLERCGHLEITFHNSLLKQVQGDADDSYRTQTVWISGFFMFKPGIIYPFYPK
jgi:hypothetical protein